MNVSTFDQYVNAEFATEINHLVGDISGWLQQQILQQAQVLSLTDQLTTRSQTAIPWTSEDFSQVMLFRQQNDS